MILHLNLGPRVNHSATRYLDLLTSFISLYNTVMKLFFIGSAAGTVYLMYLKFKVRL